MGLKARHQCPLCGSPLTEARFEQVLNIDEKRKEEAARVSAAWQRRLAKQEDDFRRKLAAERKTGDSKAKVKYGRRMKKLEEQLAREKGRRTRDNETWTRKVEKLHGQTEAGDRGHLGPEGEEELVAVLRRHFTRDDIQRKGRGGDVIHTVIDGSEPVGKIVYECKRTSTWEGAYVRQLKSAMEATGTRYGLLVTRTLPSGATGLCEQKGILVVAPHLAQVVASILREMIVELARARLPEEDRAAKTWEVFRYLQSDEFKSAVETIGDRVRELRVLLEREKSQHHGWWEKREQHYTTVARQTSGVENRVREILAAAPSRVRSGA